MTVIESTLHARYRQARTVFHRSTNEFAQWLEYMPFADLDEAGFWAVTIEVHGDMDEDFNNVLRVQRIVGPAGVVIFDVDDPSEALEDLVGEIESDYLHWLVDLSPGDWMNDNVLERPTSEPTTAGPIEIDWENDPPMAFYQLLHTLPGYVCMINGVDVEVVDADGFNLTVRPINEQSEPCGDPYEVTLPELKSIRIF